MQDSEGDELPVFLVGGVLKAKARYPGRVELADWAGVTEAPAVQTPKASSCCSAPVQASAQASGCCGGAAKAAPAP
jgi:hypothetical protein